ncbi:MAG: hypothetical protein CMJ18_23880 [Phycisphaeraceae bacterium]|nr:hypothetical protein [Phycisphaeraceae bacterium]
MSAWQPDFERFRTCIARRQPTDRVPTAEVGIDMEIIEAYLGEPVDLARYAKFWSRAGYDYVLLQVRGQPLADSTQVRIAEGRLRLHGDDETVATYESARIHDEPSFEAYPWIGPQDVYYRDVDEIRPYLPDGMKLIVNCGPIFQFLCRSMGFEAMSIAMFEDPALIEAIVERTGSLCIDIVSSLVQREWVGGIWYGDDMGFTTGLLVSPEFLRTYVFPWIRRIGTICRSADRIFLFHSDGLLDRIVPDLIDCGIQGLHPNEPASVDMVSMKSRWGDRLSLLGGVDVDLLTRGTSDEVRAATRSLVERLGASGGCAVGSGNSIARYIPLENYRAMLAAIREHGGLG